MSNMPPWMLSLLMLTMLIDIASASIGDNTPFFTKCWRGCIGQNCTEDGYEFKPSSAFEQPNINRMLFWRCSDECQYECMWKTVGAFRDRQWEMPQFFGKWPFRRVLGVQEPGSVIGSVLNFLAHLVNYSALKRLVHHRHPMFNLWQFFSAVCLNAWFWSTVFHVRDTYPTELMDYACAFSMVVVVFYCFGMRVLHGKPKLWRFGFSCVCGAYFVHHVYYLYMQKIDYAYNMISNIAAGMLGGVGWIIWSCVQWWRGRRYVWRCIAFIILSATSVLLELSDFPPMYEYWDAHAIWHLSTAPLPFLFYRFIIDDCRYVRKRLEK